MSAGNTGSAVLCLVLTAAASSAGAATVVAINAIDETGVGKPLGTVVIDEGGQGVVLKVELEGLPPGPHGFHVHENGDCGPKAKDGKTGPGLAAGGHYDPQKTGIHQGPQGRGHLGDLPVLAADNNGKVGTQVAAPRLAVADFKGRSLMIHASGDNYADRPKPLGGGGGRIACGVVK